MDRDAWIEQPLGAEAPGGDLSTAPDQPAPPTIVASGTTTFSASLPSALTALTFDAQFTADWVEEDGGGLGHPDPDAVVRHAVLQRARRITARAQVTEHERVLDELTVRLGFAAEVEGTRLRVRSVRTRLSVHPDQLALAQRFAEVQRVRSVRDVERQVELDELRHLRDSLLADPSMATVWWFRRHQDEPERIPEMAEHFHRAAAAIDAPRWQTNEQVAAVLDELFRETGGDGPWQLLLVLRRALNSLGRPDLAAQLPRAPERPDRDDRPADAEQSEPAASCGPGQGNADGIEPETTDGRHRVRLQDATAAQETPAQQEPAQQEQAQQEPAQQEQAQQGSAEEGPAQEKPAQQEPGRQDSGAPESGASAG
jgi:hypothetical protein